MEKHKADNFNLFFKQKHIFRINAAVVAHKNKIYCTYRSQHLYGYDPTTWICELNADFEVLDYKRLLSTNNNPAFEDIRLFSVGDLLFAFYTYLPRVDDNWTWDFGVGFGIVDFHSGTIKNQISLRKLGKSKSEKNWVPYFFNNEMFLVTNYSPNIRIIKIFNFEGKLVLKEEFVSANQTINWKYGELRGGTPLICPVESEQNWLYGFVHSHLTYYHGYDRYYFYTAVRLHPVTKQVQYLNYPLGEANFEIPDELLSLWRLSTKGRLKVVFPIGIMNYKNGILISFGIDDIISEIKFFKWDFIKQLFDND